MRALLGAVSLTERRKRSTGVILHRRSAYCIQTLVMKQIPMLVLCLFAVGATAQSAPLLNTGEPYSNPKGVEHSSSVKLPLEYEQVHDAYKRAAIARDAGEIFYQPRELDLERSMDKFAEGAKTRSSKLLIAGLGICGMALADYRGSIPNVIRDQNDLADLRSQSSTTADEIQAAQDSLQRSLGKQHLVEQRIQYCISDPSPTF